MNHKSRKCCPFCFEKTIWDEVKEQKNINIRGELFSVNICYFVCKKCKGEFRNMSYSPDPLDQAYREYRKRHGLLQPEEIKGFRTLYGLTQKELASLLGWGDVTISRYENGALQEIGHDKFLRLAMDPRNLLELLRRSPESISNQMKRGKIINQLNTEIQSSSQSLKKRKMVRQVFKESDQSLKDVFVD